MQPLLRRLNDLQSQVAAALERLHIETRQTQIGELEEQLSTSEIWHNPQHAQDLSKQLAALKKMVDPWVTLQAQAADMLELMDLGGEELLGEFEAQIIAFEKEYEILRKDLLFDGEFDDHNAILRLSAGVGERTHRIGRRCLSECIFAGRINRRWQRRSLSVQLAKRRA